YSSRKLGIMIALSFYIACFRLSSVRESKVSRWRRALFCASGAERERRLGGGGQPLRTKRDSWRTTRTLGSRLTMCGLCRVQGATSHIAARFLFDHEEANQYIDSGQCDEYLLVYGQIRAGVRSDVTVGCLSDTTANFARVKRAGLVLVREKGGTMRVGFCKACVRVP